MFFTLGESGMPATIHQFESLWAEIKYMPGLYDQPEGWIPYEERVVKTIGYEPTDAQFADYVQDQIIDVDETFAKLMGFALTGANPDKFEITRGELNELRDLVQLMETYLM